MNNSSFVIVCSRNVVLHHPNTRACVILIVYLFEIEMMDSKLFHSKYQRLKVTERGRIYSQWCLCYLWPHYGWAFAFHRDNEWKTYYISSFLFINLKRIHLLNLETLKWRYHKRTGLILWYLGWIYLENNVS